ncbi:MAG: hypothetical protein WC586_05400 [Methanoregula sp.]
MRPPRIPPMVTDVILTAVCSFDGVEFDQITRCPHCSGPLMGYDLRDKKFATLKESDHERSITVRVKRFTCKTCGKLINADEPFYPDSRIGSIIIDLYRTLSETMPSNRAARIIDAMGIVVDRTTWRNYSSRVMPDIPTVDIFGMKLPISILTISTIAARLPEGGRIEGAEALAACGFPSAYRAAPDLLPAGKERNKRKKQEEKEEREPGAP